MWISKAEYEKLVKNKEKKEHLELTLPILGKYHFAEYNGHSWEIFRIDKIICNKEGAHIFSCYNDKSASNLVDYFDNTLNKLLEKKNSTKDHLLLWLMDAHKMAKRVYIESDDIDTPNKGELGYSEGGYQQLLDGAIPMWWIKQELQRVLKERGIVQSE